MEVGDKGLLKSQGKYSKTMDDFDYTNNKAQSFFDKKFEPGQLMDKYGILGATGTAQRDNEQDDSFTKLNQSMANSDHGHIQKNVKR